MNRVERCINSTGFEMEPGQKVAISGMENTKQSDIRIRELHHEKNTIVIHKVTTHEDEGWNDIVAMIWDTDGIGWHPDDLVKIGTRATVNATLKPL